MNPEFLSGEASASPAVEPLMEAARRFSAAGFGAGALSARNGLRMTTHANLPLGMLTPQDFLEVADYDPHLDRILLLGRRDAHPFAGMHALVLRAKKEVNALVMLDASGAPRALEGLPVAKRGRTHLESAIAVLEALRGRSEAAFGSFLVVAGETPADAIARAAARLGAQA